MARLVQTCSIDELAHVLLDVCGAQPITFTSRTDAGAKAKDQHGNPNPFARPIWKTATVNAMVNFWFDRGVIRRLQKEKKSINSFHRGSSWHLPVKVGNRLTPLCRAKNPEIRDLYLRVMHLSTTSGPDFHDADGLPLQTPGVEPFLRSRSEYSNQGLDQPLVFKTYSLFSIVAITLQGCTFIMEKPK